MVDESVPDDEYEALRSAVKDAGILCWRSMPLFPPG